MEVQQEYLIESAKRARAKALFYQKDDPEVCILYARKFVEAVLKLLAEIHEISTSEEEMIEKLRNKLRQNKVLNDKQIDTFVDPLQRLGNVQAHNATHLKKTKKTISFIVAAIDSLTKYLNQHTESLKRESKDSEILEAWDGHWQEYSGCPPFKDKDYEPPKKRIDVNEIIKDLRFRSQCYAEVEDYETVFILWRRSNNLAISTIIDRLNVKIPKGESGWNFLKGKLRSLPKSPLSLEESAIITGLQQFCHKCAHPTDRNVTKADFDTYLPWYEECIECWQRYLDPNVHELLELPIKELYQSDFYEIDRIPHKQRFVNYEDFFLQEETAAPTQISPLLIILPGLIGKEQLLFLETKVNSILELDKSNPQEILICPTFPFNEPLSIKGLSYRMAQQILVSNQAFLAEDNFQEKMMHILRDSVLLMHFEFDVSMASSKWFRDTLTVWQNSCPSQSNHMLIMAVTWPCNWFSWHFYWRWRLRFCYKKHLASWKFMLLPRFGYLKLVHLRRFIESRHDYLSVSKLKEDFYRKHPVKIFKRLAKEILEHNKKVQI